MDRSIAATLLTLTMLTGARAAGEPATPDAARAVLEAQAPNVVTMRITAKVRISSSDAGSMDMDMAIEATGLLIDPRGLIVCSLSATDPQRFYEEFLESEDGENDYSMSTELVKITVLFESGKQVDAEPGLRDTDLDLAYFTLKGAAPEGSALRRSSHQPKAFDSLVVLRRLGDVSGRVCAGALVPVQAVVERPRRFYIVSNDITVGLGEPVFDTEGGCVGVVTIRRIKPGGSPTYFLFSGEDPYSAVVVLPVADVFEGAAQHEKFTDIGSN